MGYIYQIKNDINDQTYVGKTTRTIAKRYKEHLARIYERDNHLYFAMRKYGAEHFYVIELEQCNNELLNEREQYWIHEMNSYEDGYNETRGGDGMTILDCDEEIIPYFYSNLSTREISKILGISTNTICNCFNRFFTKDEIKIRTKRIIGEKNSTIIEQYNMNGELIATYPSLKSIPNICHRNISDVLYGRRKSAGGYLWKRQDDTTSIEKLVEANRNKYKNRNRGG